MQKAGAKTTGLGFLGIIIDDDGGYSGGLLVLNANGRPLEFHCTTTIKPSRAQEILYGPTLRPYLSGEQIGATLVGKARTTLQAVFTDEPECHALRDVVDLPLYLVNDVVESAPESANDAGAANRAREVNAAERCWAVMEGVDQQIMRCENFEQDQLQFEREIASELRYLDLVEPFARVREAIGETLNPGRAA